MTSSKYHTITVKVLRELPPDRRGEIFRNFLLLNGEQYPLWDRTTTLFSELATHRALLSEALNIYATLHDQGISPSVSQSQPTPSAPFRFPDLPPELRRMIYHQNGVLALAHDLRPPPLLLALFPVEGLYNEARDVYLTINATVSFNTLEAFKRTHLKQMLKFRHLRLHITKLRWPEFWFIRRNKMCMKNELRSFLMVLEPGVYDPQGSGIICRYLCAAGAKTLRTIVVVASPENPGEWINIFLCNLDNGWAMTENMGIVKTAIWTGTMWKFERT